MGFERDGAMKAVGSDGRWGLFGERTEAEGGCEGECRH